MKRVGLLKQTLIFCRDIEETAILYTVCLGLKIKLQSKNYLELVDGKDQRVVFYRVESLGQQLKGYSPVLVFEVESLNETLVKMKSYGCKEEGKSEGGVALLQSINGEMISIMEPTNEEEDGDDERNEEGNEMTSEIGAMLRKLRL